jgi:tetratricopeptide (TPR) repeat protein
MEQYEKIIELIEKVNLSPEEQKYLNDSIESDKDIKRLVEVYKNLKTGLAESIHIDLDMLASYILYEKVNVPDDKIVTLIADKIKLHLDNCLKCREEYEMLEVDYSDVKEYLNNTFVDDNKEQHKLMPSFLSQNIIKYRYAFTTVITLIVLYVGMFTVSSITTPNFKQDLFSAQDEDFYLTRGRTSLSFQKGLDALDKGNYTDAISYLQLDIEKHSNESSIFYSHYILGSTYLKAAESDFLGMFNSFDEEKVKLAIENLKASIEKNISGSYENLNLDANYFIGRAYLLLDDFDSAKKHLEIVINKKGRFYNEAETMIEAMEKN